MVPTEVQAGLAITNSTSTNSLSDTLSYKLHPSMHAEEEKQTEGRVLLPTFLKGRTQKTEQFREVNVLRLATSGSLETIVIVTIET